MGSLLTEPYRDAKGWPIIGPFVRLSAEQGKPLPSEVRLFAFGWNETENGRYLFDKLAAKLVMEHAAKWGVELMIDLEHLSVAPEDVTGDGRNFDPDPRGWTRLEVKGDGSNPDKDGLWIVSTRWLEDGERRIRGQLQPYLSPAFDIDDERRIVAIRNCGMTAMPATHNAYRMVARRKGQRQMKLTKGEFLAALRKCDKGQIQLLKRMALMAPGITDREACHILQVDMKTLQKVVGVLGGDTTAPLSDLFAMVIGFADELKAIASGETPAEPMPSDGGEGEGGGNGEGMLAANPEKEPDAAMARASAAEQLALLRKRDEATQAELRKLREANDERERQDKIELFREAVKARVFTPGQVWQDSEVGRLKPRLARMSIPDIKDHIRDHSDRPAMLSATPRPPTTPEARPHISAVPGVEIGQAEVDRLQYAMDQQNRIQRRLGGEELVLSSVLARYEEVKGMQLRGAKSHDERSERGGKLGEKDRPLICLVSGAMSRGQLELLAANPVAPAEPLGFSSREALREYNERYMISTATAPRNWPEDLGDVETSGALEYTYPIDFSVPKWRKRVAQAAKGETPQSADIDVAKEPYRIAKDADWNRLSRGDFAYMNSWLAGAAQFGRDRVNLRAGLIVKILVDNPVWAKSRKHPAGLTGENIFSEAHPINPFNSKTKNTATGLATFSNYSPSGLPLDATNLSLLKDKIVLVPYLDGIPFGVTATHILHPTILTRTASDLLTVQDLILAGELVADSGAGVGTMGQVRNPHYNSGLQTIQAPHLPGTTPATADYYLFSEMIKQMGYSPWVIAEDSTELVLDRDIDSDHFKDTGFIRVERELYISAVFVWPQAIHKVKAVAP